LLGYLTVERAGRRPWLAFLVGLMLVLVPGMTFKNYMPLLAVGNAFCLLHFALASRPEKEHAQGKLWRWLIFGSLALGLTFLIRIDVGLFCTLLWLGALVLVFLQWKKAGASAAKLLVGGPVLLATIVLAIHLPVYLDAKRRGFAEPFLVQYSNWPKSIAQ